MSKCSTFGKRSASSSKTSSDAIVSADDVTRHKPEPQTFLECARLMGVEPQFCQVFEDGVLGIEAAKKAGMMVTDVRQFINYGEWIRS